MAKSIKEILKGVKSSKKTPGSTGEIPAVDYKPKSKGDQDFVASHETEKFEDRAGNKDDVYNASNIKHAQKKEAGHGIISPNDVKKYKKANEEVDHLSIMKAVIVEKLTEDHEADCICPACEKAGMKLAQKKTFLIDKKKK